MGNHKNAFKPSSTIFVKSSKFLHLVRVIFIYVSPLNKNVYCFLWPDWKLMKHKN